MKVCRFILSICFFVNLFSFSSYAYKQAPFLVVNVVQNSLPEDAKYLDLLVKVKSLEDYGDFLIGSTNSKCSDIREYHLDNFISYTYYCCRSSNFIQINNCNKADGQLLCDFGENDLNIDYYDEIKFAYLNDKGQVLSITNSIKVDSKIPFYLIEGIELNGTIATASFHLPYQNFILLGIVIFFIIFLLILKTFFKR